jgi:glutamyl-tRNA(Gln) amidotransferase subunit D
VVELELRQGPPVVGTLLPRYQYDDQSHLVVKLKNGYNVGVAVEKIASLKRLRKGDAPMFASSSLAVTPSSGTRLPVVAILGTGGTIASRVDYRTGAVYPAISSAELYSLMPELSQIADIRPEVVLSMLSENLEPSHWGIIAEKVGEKVRAGAQGVVITTGTDVMGYTSAALTFALHGIPVPVLVVGSQRSSDRPSSDAFLNLVGATEIAASSDIAGVYVVMHSNSSDNVLSVHSGTRVRKNHTSSRDAFQSIGVEPSALWSWEGLSLTGSRLPARRQSVDADFSPKSRFDPNVALLKFYPSMRPHMLEAFLTKGELRGLIIEGTGLGHVSSKILPVLADFIKGGGIVGMTSQCVWGRVDLNVYETGRDLLAAGVIPLQDTLAETALVKMMWVLGNAQTTEEAKRLMQTNLGGEMTGRTTSPGMGLQ